ncbi:hypothetical protein LA345_39900 (plasmid) [Burkholderia vietnamiensis]|uniref:Uncharacterized protein n=1 Tax=Burkholderia vietnamiensis (strain G4 / LMG 22486) TaxID=269482 RepID=A4JUC9_BURVG|nr:hypothetical protein Bcep1808_6996 [Burkholderia vietnamiensis G4]MCB4349956.1 hypothetical protein [Burkholderia vietnamiensis]
MAAHDRLTEHHFGLSNNDSLPVGERYRQLAAYHVATGNFRRAIQAMCASTASAVDYVPLDALAGTLRAEPMPQWLRNSGEAANYPRSESDVWADVEGLAEQHADISRMAISPRVTSIHGAIAYILSGRYGFAVQCLKAAEMHSSDDELSLEDLVAGNVTVDADPAWRDCWSDRE